jgi:L-seryl-tRNA(Ser) seleniumtransferase
MPNEALSAGAHLVAFSGDKLLGGPQAGIIAGSLGYITALKREPFYRALRCDKLVLSALQATVEMILGGRTADIPIRAAIDVPIELLTARVEMILGQLQDVPLQIKTGSGTSQVGGGSLPKSAIPSVTLDVLNPPKDLGERLRRAAIPVIGYLSAGTFKLDLRTIFPRQDEQLIAAIRAAACHQSELSS